MYRNNGLLLVYEAFANCKLVHYVIIYEQQQTNGQKQKVSKSYCLKN